LTCENDAGCDLLPCHMVQTALSALLYGLDKDRGANRMEQEHNSGGLSLVFQAKVFFLVVSGWWLYGIFTTFFRGQIPVWGWTTDHNIILGVLWILVLGQGAPVPLKAFMRICVVIAIWRRGYVYLPLFLLNFLFQLYSWIMIITVWFPQPLPRPFEGFTGGILTGVIALVVIIPLCVVGNVTACRVLRSFTKREPR
jgi:hypothetical protein